MKDGVGDSRPSRPVPSPALPCPRARALGTSQPAPQLLLHAAAHAARPSPALGTGHALRDGDKTQGDGLHPHTQHRGDLGATAGQAAIPTALGTPGLAAATRGQVTPSPPTPLPHPEPRGWGRARLSAEPQANLPPVRDRCAAANTLKHDGKPWLEIATERAPQWQSALPHQHRATLPTMGAESSSWRRDMGGQEQSSCGAGLGL